MTGLTPADFARFFEELWDKPPFAWQKDLAKCVMGQDSWPEAIALPAASGKTACLDIAVFALAAQAERLAVNEAITAPRRIFFVVDRRVIVDQAYERACRMRSSLRDANSGILKDVADRLRLIAHGETTGFDCEVPLASYSLRGGMYRSEAWARDPLQPMIVASTVDQVGSRLLFRGYGRGDGGAWPIYAGLVANDSLILLDEAHCAQPFMQTLQAVKRFRTWAHEPLERSFYPVVMSATPPPNLADVFKDESNEGSDPSHTLGRRQLAHKPTILKKVGKATGDQATDELAKAMSKEAEKLIDSGLPAVVVFANRVATARKIHRLLDGRDDVESVLLTGRMRPVDKDAVVSRLSRLYLHSDQSAERRLEKPVVAVATQTLEVGADLDFDGLVSECASLDALRQRFGRLNRMGRDIDARAVILVRADQAKLNKRNNEDDPVYGAAIAKTWDWLDGRKNRNGEVDFGIAYLDKELSSEDLTDLEAPSLDAPVMLPAHVDCWGQTSPVPEPSPDVALFLHGPRDTAPDVQVCWRAGLDLANGMDEALELLRLCPPSSSETLPVPIGTFKRWLAGEGQSDDSADVEGADVEGAKIDANGDDRGTSSEESNVVRWRGRDTGAGDVTSNPSEVRPGDVIVIPTEHPGPFKQIGDLPSDAVRDALDVGDQAYRLARAKPILRLQRELVEKWPDTVTAKAAALELLEGLGERYEEDPGEVGDALHEILGELAVQSEPIPADWGWLPEAARELRKVRYTLNPVGDRRLVIVGRHRVPGLEQEADLFSDEDDGAASGISHRNRRPVKLENHLRGVEAFARRYALGSGLCDEIAGAVACAGLLHDLGKADPRFQSMLLGGRRWGGSEYLGKSAGYPKTQAARDAARKVAGYPSGRPHPLLSVRLAESAPGLLPESDDMRDLVLHLVASHHGHCRPFAPVIFDESPEDVCYSLDGSRMSASSTTNLERLDSGVADRYWQLVRRYGWWGLAWLEAILRLADWRRSEWEESHDDDE